MTRKFLFIVVILVTFVSMSLVIPHSVQAVGMASSQDNIGSEANAPPVMLNDVTGIEATDTDIGNRSRRLSGVNVSTNDDDIFGIVVSPEDENFADNLH